MKKIACYLAFTGAAVFSFNAAADEFSDASLALCEKIKSCAVAQMGKQEMTPEVRQMMQPMLDNMCSNMLASMPEVTKGHDMYGPAMACMSSLEALSCDEMQGGNGAQTDACEEYEKLTEKYDPT